MAETSPFPAFSQLMTVVYLRMTRSSRERIRASTSAGIRLIIDPISCADSRSVLLKNPEQFEILVIHHTSPEPRF